MSRSSRIRRDQCVKRKAYRARPYDERVENRKVNREEIIKLIPDLIHESVPSEDLSDVNPEIPLPDQLELDSVDFLNISMEPQMRYGLEIPEEDFMELTSLNRCCSLLGV